MLDLTFDFQKKRKMHVKYLLFEHHPLIKTSINFCLSRINIIKNIKNYKVNGRSQAAGHLAMMAETLPLFLDLSSRASAFYLEI